MRVPRPGKSTLRKMMDEEEFLSKAAGCPPGHTYNPVIKKCLPGSPLAGIGDVYGGGKGGNAGTGGALGAGNVGQGGNAGQTSGKGGKSGPSANAMIAAEAYDRAVKAKTQ